MSATVRPERFGDDVLRPSVLVAVGVLLVNDHLLKHVAPGWVTGKLSDATGLYATPFVIATVASVVAWAAGWPGRVPRRVVAISAVFTATVFAVTKLVPEAAAAMGWLIGWVQALATGVFSLLAEGDAPIRQAPIAPDPTDLLMLPAAGLAVLVAGRRGSTAALGGAPAARRRALPPTRVVSQDGDDPCGAGGAGPREHPHRVLARDDEPVRW